ncbi:hypothetical protein SPHINGO8AM_40148 [Sphingomonas sp. 8AM]|nr:hypothetical protein SPHINGO8AM_40148 [Sphingomonas sp. 8AM]
MPQCGECAPVAGLSNIVSAPINT